MKLSTRILLPILATVALVMPLYAAWSLRHRERIMVAEARRETQAYAVALEFAIESAFRDPRRADVQGIIDRISREPTIYGVFVYGPDALPMFVSNPLSGASPAPADSVGRVLRDGVALAFERQIDQERVFSVLRPIRAGAGGVAGAFEVAQPLATLRAELTRTRQRFLLNTLTLLAAVTIVILALLRRLVGVPLERFVAAARALARGELAYRIAPDGRTVELAALATEFNRMAGHLETARADLVREAEERLALERRLRESEKLAAIGNLAAGLAHEMGAPLHVIRGRSEILLRRSDMTEPARRNLRIIDEQTRRITHIVRNLLDFSRRREPRVGRVDIGAIARGAAELLEPEMQKVGVAFRWEGQSSLWVEGDPDLLHQVFVNLFMNALYALQTVDHERVIECHGSTADGIVRIDVRDSGPGIADEVGPRVFEPFFTTKPGAHGTGLGLAVARSIMEEHGGTLDLASCGGGAPRAGAVFRVRLAEAAAREAQRA